MRFELQGSDERPIVVWDGGRYDGETPIVSEAAKFGLVIYGGSPDVCYSIVVGEERLDVKGRQFGANCYLEKGPYFESAFARTILSVTKQESNHSWTTLAECELYVLPSKIGNDNYQQMVRDLQIVCKSLINDLIGKSRHGQEWDAMFRPILFRSREEELMAIRRTWRDMAPLLEEITVAPVSKTVLFRTLAPCGRNKSYRDVSALMKAGEDPRNPSPGRKSITFRLKESLDLPEHHLIKGFVIFLLLRLNKCRIGVNNDMVSIEADKLFRTKATMPGEISLYEQEDIPRLRKLRHRASEIDSLCGEIQDMLLTDFWRDMATEVEFPKHGQFAEGIHYIKIANIILRYLQNGLNTGETYGSDFMTKKTSRMYEQWVLIQIVSALECCGLDIETWDSVVRRCISSQFGLDFKKNTQFLARLEGCYSILLRYEPWILPHGLLASHQEETLCHFGTMDSFWSPDFVMELLKMENGRFKTVYAVALDAKYSRNPSSYMRHNVEKYLKIRSNDGRNGRQVTHQVWLVYLGDMNDPEGVFSSDESMEFSSSLGPVYSNSTDTIAFDEHITGDILMRPHNAKELENVGEMLLASPQAHGIAIHKPVLDFVQGTLSYFRAFIKEYEG